MTDSRADLQAADTMALLASLSVAAEWYVAHRERGDGHDPSEQEEVAFARERALGAGDALGEMLMRLGTTLAPEETPGIVATVRHFDRMLILRRAGRLLHTLHQRLLSLYPSVAAELIEEARLLEGARAELTSLSAADFVEEAPTFVGRGLGFVRTVRDTLAG